MTPSQIESLKESLGKIEWAIKLSQVNLKTLREGDWINLKEELIDFVRASGTSLDLTGRVWAEPKAFQQWINGVRRGLRGHLERLAHVGVAAIRQAGPTLLQDVGIGFPASGYFIVGAIKGQPYRLLVKTDTIESQVYSALASYLVSSGIVAGQIRKCPILTCGRIFLYKRKPRADKKLHCNIKCSRVAATRNYRKKNADKLKEKERDRNLRRKLGLKVGRWPSKARGD